MKTMQQWAQRWWRVAAGVLALGAGLVLGAPPAAPAGAAPAAASPPHVMTIIMENTDYSQFAGSAAMPYLNELGHEYADFTQAYGWHYPSLPNYLELLSGSHEGVDGDCDITRPNCSGFTNPTLVDQLEAAGITWHAYYQGLDSGCDQGDGSGNYPYWHNPFRYFADFSTQCHDISNFDPLLSDLSGPHAADFNWVVPDLVNSGGDNGTMASGDDWLSAAVPQIMNTPWYRAGGQIVIMYDTGYEDAGGVGGASGGQIPTVVVSAHTAGKGADSRPVTTAGVLRSIEGAYGLPDLGDAANPINGSLGGALVSGLPTGAPVPTLFSGLVASTTTGNPTVTATPGTLTLNGIAPVPGGGTIEVGESQSGLGVVDTPALGPVVVPGTSDLLSVACRTASHCDAVGIAPVDEDEAVWVTLVNGQPTKVQALPAFYGLYGIACPSTTTCVAVGYDTAHDADAVTTAIGSVVGPPQRVPGGGEWLNAVSCSSANQCDAVGLGNSRAEVVPIAGGVPQAALPVPGAWYVNGIDCSSGGECTVVGETAKKAEGLVASVNGTTVTSAVVPGTEYLYGVSCVPGASCILAGAGSPGLGQSTGVLVDDVAGELSGARAVRGTSGLGQTVCGVALTACEVVGAGSG
jgi:phosphatidylinositol-3-phosphatase